MDYTAVIESVDATGDLRAMALYDRSVIYAAQQCDALAISDLKQLLETPGAAAQVKTEARRKLVRMQRTTDRATEASSARES